MSSIIKVNTVQDTDGNNIINENANTITIGASGDTVSIPSGATLTTTNATVNLPATPTVSPDLKTNKFSPATGTAFTLGDSGDTFTVPAGATITNSGTATGFGGGKLLQVVQAVKTDTFSSASASWVDITGLSLSITPSSASSKIFITANFVTSHSAANSLGVKLIRDTTAIYQGDDTGTRKGTSSWQFMGSSNKNAGSSSFQYVDEPNTTSATTYKLQIWATGGTAYIGQMSGDSNNTTYGRSASAIIAMEIGA